MKSHEHVVIVGAGNAGLYAANSLQKRGIRSITILDSRTDHETKPEHVTDQTIDEEKTKVEIIKGTFVHFEKKKLFYRPSDSDNLQQLPCNLVLECTGSERAVIKYVNSHHLSKSFFRSTPVGDNRYQRRIIASVKLNPEDYAALIQHKISNLEELLGIEQLRQKFSWPEMVMPFTKLDHDEICFYCELPKTLQKNQHDDWISTLLKIKSGKSNIQFEKLLHPRKYREFTVDPHQITPFIFPGNQDIPMVIPLGNAQIDADYRIDLGIHSGTHRTDLFLKSLTISDGKITSINEKNYQYVIAPVLTSHRDIIKALDSKEVERHHDYSAIHNRYAAALKETETKPDSAEHQVVRMGAVEACSRLAGQLLETAKQKIKEACDNGGRILIKTDNTIQYATHLQDGTKHLLSALEYASQTTNEALKTTIRQELHALADRHQKLAGSLFQFNQYQLSKANYEQAIYLYKKINPEQYQEQLIKLYSHLAIMANHLMNYQEAYLKANSALYLLLKVEFKEKEKIQIQLIYNKTLAQLNILAAQVKQKTHDQETLHKSIKSISMIIEALESSPYIIKCNRERLTRLYLTLEQELTKPAQDTGLRKGN